MLFLLIMNCPLFNQIKKLLNININKANKHQFIIIIYKLKNE